MTTLALLAFIVLCLVVGYLWHRSLARKDETRAADLATLRADLLEAQGDLEEMRRDRDAQKAGAVQLAKSRIQHDERHACLPTLDGIRAESRENPPDVTALTEQIRCAFEGEPLRDWERKILEDFDREQEQSKVVPIRGGRS